MRLQELLINQQQENKIKQQLKMHQSQKGIGIFKKGKTSQSGYSSSASRASEHYVKQKNDDFSYKSVNREKVKQNGRGLDEGSWMGEQTPRMDNFMKIQNAQNGEESNKAIGFKKTQSKIQQLQPEALLNTLASKFSGTGTLGQSAEKSPAKLIQQILKGVSNGTLSNIHQSNPYYSQETEQLLTQLLTNKNKLNSYIEDLQQEISDLPENIAQNYEILIILLTNISRSDVQVKLISGKGLELNFNTQQIVKQEHEIEALEKKIKQKDDQLKQIVEDYESVIKNFNDVIEKLLDQRDALLNGNSMRGPIK